jgi:hypothetical protein
MAEAWVVNGGHVVIAARKEEVCNFILPLPDNWKHFKMTTYIVLNKKKKNAGPIKDL